MKTQLLSLAICIFFLLPSLCSGQAILEKAIANRQQQLTGYTPGDADYCFLEGSKLKDIRDYSTKIPRIEADKTRRLDASRYLVQRGMAVYCFKNHQQVHAIALAAGDHTSPELDRVISRKDNDLWLKEINWDNGSIKSEKRLTETGVFGINSYYIMGWHKDKIMVSVHGEIYLLRLNDKSLKKLDIRYNPNVYQVWTTPSGRYYGAHLSYFDFVKEQEFNVNDQYFKGFEGAMLLSKKPIIIDEHTVAYHVWGADPQKNIEGQSFLLIADLRQPATPQILEINTAVEGVTPEPPANSRQAMMPFLRSANFTKSMIEPNQWGSSSTFSPGLKKICFTTRTAPNGLFVFDLTTGKAQLVEKDIQQTMQNNIMARNDLTFGWVTDNTLIYSKNEGVMDQGTFLYHADTGKKQKLTPFIMQESVILHAVDKLVFRANNKLFTCNSDGTNLKVLQENIFHRVSPFLH